MSRRIIKIQRLLDDYNQFLCQKGLTKESRKRFARMAERLVLHLQEEKVDIFLMTQADCQNYLYTLQHLKPSTYNAYISYMTCFLRYLEERYDVQHIVLKKKNVETFLPNYLPVEVLHKLCTPTELERARLLNDLTLARDQSIVEILASTGLRSCELRHLRVGDLSPDLRICRVATAKGGYARFVFLGVPAASALKNYLRLNDVQLRKHSNEYLFPGRNPKNPLSYESLRGLLIRIAQYRIGTPVTTHALRHTFATEMMRSCGCIRSVQLLMGHVSISNTVRYCHLNLADTLKAVEKFHPHGEKACVEEEVDKNEQ